MNAFEITKRSPSFILVWLGQILSQSGGRMYQIAVLWWILARFPIGPGKWVGAFMVTVALPSILFARAIGGWIDRHRSQSILVNCDLGACCVLALAALLLKLQLFSLPLAFLIGFCASTLQAFIDPTLNKAVQEVVAEQDFENGIALLATTQSLANFAGAVFGAILIDRLGIWGTVGLAAIGYLVSSTASRIARFKPMSSEGKDISVGGWELLKDMPFIKRLLIAFALINFFATPTLVVLPVYTKKVLLASATVLGTLEAGIWIGILLGSLGSRLVSDSLSRIKVGAVCLGIFGVCLLVPAFWVSIPLYWVALFFAGLALGINNVKFMALFQERVRPEIKGRFFALMQGVIGFTFPIAYFLFGALTDVMSPQTVCMIQGAGVIVLAVYFISLLRWETA